MKKILSLVLSLVLLISMATAVDFTAKADGNYTIEVGETLNLYAQTAGYNVVYGSAYWSSYDDAVQIVSQNHTMCTIRGVSSTGRSRAYVECRFQHRSSTGFIGTGMVGFYITVEEPQAWKIELSPQRLTLKKGEGYQLSAIVTPSEASENIKWTTDTDAVTVNNGYVYACNCGSGYVSASAPNGVRGNCYVTVDHSFKDTVTKKATTKKNGSVTRKCSDCGNVTKITTSPIKKVTLSKTSYVYDGKAKKPTVTVRNGRGNIINSKYYTVTYSKGRKNVGKYTVTIKFKGRYSGTVKKTFKIKPETTSITKLTAQSKAFTVKWKKQTKQTSGYEIQYSKSNKFNNAKVKTISKNSRTSRTISKLRANTKYYVRVRAYKTIGKAKYYSAWSSAKSVTTKK